MKRVVVCLLFCALIMSAQDRAKQYKPGEFESYNDAAKDIGAANFQKAIADLNAWRQKYPDSDYKDDRDVLCAQAYAGINDPAKSLDAVSPMIANGLETVFPGVAGQPTILRVLYSASWAISRIANPTSEEVSAGNKAARQLLDWEKPLAGVPAQKWTEARIDMKEKATAALAYLAMLPGEQAMAKQPPDCAAANAAFTSALNAYPERAALAYELGRALLCEAKTSPDKIVAAIYEFERAAAIDPTLGGARNDPKQVQNYADSAYTKYHGSDEGLAEVRQAAAHAPLPPTGFTIRSADQISEEKRAAFESANPQLALWAKIRAALLAPDGEQYFESALKGASVPQLAGRLLEAKPECRPRELLIGIALPDSTEPLVAEIRLELVKPLTGKPDIGTEFRWEGVPSAFAKQPFLLTMDAESTKLEGLNLKTCTASKR